MSSPKGGRWAAVLCLGLMAGMAPRAEAGFSAIVAFGDSLTDTGNAHLGALGLGLVDPVPPPYFNGRYSNGPLWIETLAAGLGVASPQPSLIGGTNYAFGGAETDLTGLSSLGTPNLGVQVDNYLKTQPTAAIAASQLFVVWGGADDLLHQTMPSTAASVANLTAEINRLIDAGGKDFLVPNLPWLGVTPAVRRYGLNIAEAYNAMTEDFNRRLAISLTDLAASRHVTIHQLDVNHLFQDVLSAPDRFGITNTTDTAKSGDTSETGTVVGNPDNYLFWDTVHPTAPIHARLGEIALAEVTVPEPSSLVMVGMAVVFGTAVARVRARRAA